MPVEAPLRGEHRRDRGRGEDADAVDHSVAEQHPADAGQIARGDAKPPLRGEHRAIGARDPAGEVAAAVARGADGAGGAAAVEVVLHCFATLGEHHRAGNRSAAAAGPVEAGVEAHRGEDVGLHPLIEALPGRALDHRGDDREVHVGISEITRTGGVRGAPRARVGHDFTHAAVERDGILIVVIAHAGGVAE